LHSASTEYHTSIDKETLYIHFSGWLTWHLALKLRQIPKVGSCMTSSTQLRDILGISGSTDSSSAIDSAEVIRRGLSIESFKRVAGYYQLTDVQMSKVVGTSVR
jgi:hypothetical protein